jgi:hypothetical protein
LKITIEIYVETRQAKRLFFGENIIIVRPTAHGALWPQALAHKAVYMP